MERFGQALMAYLDYDNNRRIKGMLKGLPSAMHRQQAFRSLEAFSLGNIGRILEVTFGSLRLKAPSDCICV